MFRLILWLFCLLFFSLVSLLVYSNKSMMHKSPPLYKDPFQICQDLRGSPGLLGVSDVNFLTSVRDLIFANQFFPYLIAFTIIPSQLSLIFIGLDLIKYQHLVKRLLSVSVIVIAFTLHPLVFWFIVPTKIYQLKKADDPCSSSIIPGSLDTKLDYQLANFYKAKELCGNYKVDAYKCMLYAFKSIHRSLQGKFINDIAKESPYFFMFPSYILSLVYFLQLDWF